MASNAFTGSGMVAVYNMQFRGYIFSTNPEKISVSETRNIVRHFCPGDAEISQDLGKKARLVTCTGSFWGASFSEAVAELINFRDQCGGVGMLYLPGIPPFPARIAELAFDAQGDGRIIPYVIKFIEAVGE